MLKIQELAVKFTVCDCDNIPHLSVLAKQDSQLLDSTVLVTPGHQK